MAGVAFISVGRRKTGKTTFSKMMLEKSDKPKIIYDVNQEYTDIYDEPFEDFETFMDRVVELKNHYILFEEATIFFDTRANYFQMKNLLVRARHTNNTIQLNFHSFKSVPKNIYNLLDYVAVFKTNDTEKDIKEKFDHEGVLKGCDYCRNSEDPFVKRIVSLY